ncbi:MAG TPA: hypothetical protein VE995_05660 [Gaiellaceae bacterium]|nr:hypothetical protein [Gaiellaceae bacterium]
MRGVWAALVSVWATLAIVAALAWTRPRPNAATPSPTPTALVVKGANGKRQLVLVPGPAAAAPHATTQSSPVPPA